MTNKPLIAAKGLSVHYALRGKLIGPKPYVGAVENVDIDVFDGTDIGFRADQFATQGIVDRQALGCDQGFVGHVVPSCGS